MREVPVLFAECSVLFVQNGSRRHQQSDDDDGDFSPTRCYEGTRSRRCSSVVECMLSKYDLNLQYVCVHIPYTHKHRVS